MKKVEGVLSPPGAPPVGEGSKPASTTTSIKSPGKVGIPSVKTPKSKSMPDATDKPSKFFKKEEFDNIKQTSIEKLRTFLEKVRAKK